MPLVLKLSLLLQRREVSPETDNKDDHQYEVWQKEPAARAATVCGAPL